MKRKSAAKVSTVSESGGPRLTEREVAYRARPRALLVAVAAAMAPALAVPTAARAATPAATLTVASGETVELTSTTTLSALTIEEGGTITVPDGYSLTLTVDGVETGSELAELTDGYGGVATAIVAGTYTGTVVLTVATANELTYSTLMFPFRQALYVGGSGVVRKESVLASVVGGRPRTRRRPVCRSPRPARRSTGCMCRTAVTR